MNIELHTELTAFLAIFCHRLPVKRPTASIQASSAAAFVRILDFVKSQGDFFSVRAWFPFVALSQRESLNWNQMVWKQIKIQKPHTLPYSTSSLISRQPIIWVLIVGSCDIMSQFFLRRYAYSSPDPAWCYHGQWKSDHISSQDLEISCHKKENLGRHEESVPHRIPWKG